MSLDGGGDLETPFGSLRGVSDLGGDLDAAHALVGAYAGGP